MFFPASLREGKLVSTPFSDLEKVGKCRTKVLLAAVHNYPSNFLTIEFVHNLTTIKLFCYDKRQKAHLTSSF